ncbi:p-loop NTPase [Homarus gammarus nudivirus]|uniref:p-loop NTPase n=1 Tax=Homarus gammarus nudivirus TaxID=2509616 RepID=A0A411HB88_9VIRU|nr:p-loop NTPase [Homarus gammarus nudivirus]QBB28658.1 p-loop NTPase [Homarus gammarus nudivirus]
MISNIIQALEDGKFIKYHKPIINYGHIDKDDIWFDINSPKITRYMNDNDLNLKFNLEQDMLTLPKKYLVAYVIASSLQVFDNKYNRKLLYDSRYGLDDDSRFIISVINQMLHKYYADNYYFVLNINSKIHTLAWNDFIIPELANHLYPSVYESKAELRDSDHYMHNEIYPIIKKLFYKDQKFIEGLTSKQACDNFLYATKNAAVCVNGTACVGKTSLLLEIQEEIKKTHDPLCRIMKLGTYGTYKGKDQSQTLALTYQSIGMSLVMNEPASLMDRDPFNNLIWRIILQLMGTYETDESFIVAATNLVVSTLSRNLMATISQFPIIFLVDFDETANRERMFNRATGGDRKRCYIKNYVMAQNIIYGLCAYLANCPVFQTAMNTTRTPDNRKAIKNLIISKILANGKNNNKLNNRLNINVRFKSDYEENFSASDKIKIMK